MTADDTPDWVRPIVHWEILARVPALGGTVVSSPFDVPGGPTIASIEDPEGNPLVLVQQ